MHHTRRDVVVTFMISGYSTDAEWEARIPTWETGERFPTQGDAEEAGRVWLTKETDDAVVEVIELSIDGSEGWVRLLLSHGESEQIIYPDQRN
jgi:hypothetical protein